MIYKNANINQKIWERLNDYLIKDKLPNALLFHGYDGVGKEACAIEFATIINCNNKMAHASCGECISCVKMKKMQHGNIKLIHPMPRLKSKTSSGSPLENLSKTEIENYTEQLILKSNNPYYKINLPNSNSILINSIRYLKKELQLSSIEKGWNIVLILDADRLSYPSNVSANALLKILEEPPEKTLFILTTSNYSKIIDTIKSRCQEIFFPPLSTEYILKSLKNDLTYNDNYIISTISNGNMNIAIKLSDSIGDIYNDLKLFINACYTPNYKYNEKIVNRVNVLKRGENYELILFFRIITIYFKDLFVFSKSRDLKYVVYKNLDKHYQKMTKHYNNTRWEICIDILDNTQNNIMKNSSVPLSIHGMLIEIKKNISNKSEIIPFSINSWLQNK